MKVTLFKSTDGSLHESKSECDKHNATIAAAPAIKESINAEFSLEGDQDSISVDEVVAWAVKHAAQLVEILAPFVPAKPRIPRKLKAVVEAAAPGPAADAIAVFTAVAIDAGIAKAMGVQPA